MVAEAEDAGMVAERQAGRWERRMAAWRAVGLSGARPPGLTWAISKTVCCAGD